MEGDDECAGLHKHGFGPDHVCRRLGDRVFLSGTYFRSIPGADRPVRHLLLFSSDGTSGVDYSTRTAPEARQSGGDAGHRR